MEMVRPEITICHIKIYRDLVHHRIDSQPLKRCLAFRFQVFSFKQKTHGLTWQLLQAWNSSRPTCVDAQKPSQAFRNGFFGRVGKKHDWASDLRLNKKINKKRPIPNEFFFQPKDHHFGGRFICGMVKAVLGTWFFCSHFSGSWLGKPSRGVQSMV